MKVILLQAVSGLGKMDDIKEVAEGYARNFLFPRHLAVPASGKAVKELGDRHHREQRQAEQDLVEQQKAAERLDGREVEIDERASASGTLYAAVNQARVKEALERIGFSIETTQIHMKPIKEAGSYTVKIKFRHGLEAEITVLVTALK